MKIIGSALINIPWEERPQNCRDVLWRYSGNPIIKRDQIPCSNSIFNSAVVPFNDTFAGVFRCDNRARQMRLHAGFSPDGISWNIDHDTLNFIGADPEIADFAYGYDPRVCWLEDRYYVTWCNCFHGPAI
jgi:beta-1,4-mannooligosaccharide/beta-1,4-mannosyl-N-acetylglucosamine phosphorylase